MKRVSTVAVGRPLKTRVFAALVALVALTLPVASATDAWAANPKPPKVKGALTQILLVEPSASEAVAFTDFFSKSGASVTVARDAEGALKAMGEKSFNVVIVASQLPGQNGFQLTRSITRDPRFGSVPVIMRISGGNQGADGTWALRMGARATVVRDRNYPALAAMMDALR